MDVYVESCCSASCRVSRSAQCISTCTSRCQDLWAATQTCLQSLLAPNLLHLSLHEMATSLQLALEELHICHSLGLGGCQVGSHVTPRRHEGSPWCSMGPAGSGLHSRPHDFSFGSSWVLS